jgi:chemotaxis protein methyltransferase CheR
MTSGAAIEQFVELIREVTGNLVPPSRHGFVGEVAERRAQVSGFRSVAAYVRALAGGALAREWESLVPLITIKESYFFRAPQQFEAIAGDLLPRLLRARAGARHLRIWSAACARGEEPATLAMLLAEDKALAAWDWSILATDLDEEALAGARRGLYGERAVAQIPPALLARHFVRRGKLFELAPELRSRIDYRGLNLAHPPFGLPLREYDLILLRNVLIYFRREVQNEVVTQAAQALARRGYLFLGASETLWQIQEALEAVDLGTCFCYRHRRARPHGATGEAADSTAAAERRALAAAGLPRAADRKPPATAGPRAAADRPAATRVEQGVAPDSSLSAPCGVHERLMAAARDLAGNRIDRAALAIDQALAADPSEPAAHALEGFLHDVAGRTEEAVTSYRAALYLDPALYQARLLLADCLLRLGQRERAEHHYREVLASLGSGRERPLAAFADLPLPDRTRALRRCRQALRAS